MHLRVKHYLASLAVLTLVIPVYAKTYKQPLVVDKGVTIGSTQLKSGSYEVAADDSKKEISITQKGKVVATVPGQWVKMPEKSRYSTFISSGDKITQVEFSGIDQVFQPQ